MIEKIIIQDSKDVQSVWIPDRRSMASFAIWKTYGLGHHAHWQNGRITLGVNADAEMSFFYEFPGYMDKQVFPSWIDSVLHRIDEALPSTDMILNALDADTITMPIDPPAYRIPHAPCAQDIATCLLASRLLLAVRAELLPPMHLSDQEMAEELHFASKIAVLLGGETSSILALSSAGDPTLCEILPDPHSDDDLILKEDDDV